MLYKELETEGFFEDKRDVALIGLTDMVIRFLNKRPIITELSYL